MEPQILFPLIAVLSLTAIWGITLAVIKVRHSDAEHAAAVSTRELFNTYDAQVSGALSEIDRLLYLVQGWPEGNAGRHTLSDLRNKKLLPPGQTVIVGIVDVNGVVVESTQPAERQNVADQDFFLKQRDADVFFMGQIPRGPTGEAKLYFSRRLRTPMERSTAW